MASSKQTKELKESHQPADQVAKPEEQVVQQAEPQKIHLIYCGPNVAKLGLIHSTTYIGGYPKHLESHFEKCPALKRLFVPIQRATATLQAVTTPGAPEKVWFEEVLAYAKGGA